MTFDSVRGRWWSLPWSLRGRLVLGLALLALLALGIGVAALHSRLLVATGLAAAWAALAFVIGHRLLHRLQALSCHLRDQAATGAAPSLETLIPGSDEVAEMARSLQCLAIDSARLAQRNSELASARHALHEQGDILELIATRAPLPRVLDRLVRWAEAQLEGLTGAILLLDGLHLRHGATARLPEHFVKAIDGLHAIANFGSCGAAVQRHGAVFVEDIALEPSWLAGQALAAKHGLRACWSMPILSHKGTVLGTFAMYADRPRNPQANELHCIEAVARLAGLAIERQRAEQRIRHMAHQDLLTGLPNRTLLNDRMAQALAQARRTGHPLAVLVIDIDGFKYINDSLGQAAGDRLLRAVAARLQDIVREGDTVARLGGDEFVVLLVDLDRAERASQVAEEIVRTLALPLRIGGQAVDVTASVGVSTFPDDSDDGDSLLQQASEAMLRTKELGRNGFQRYTPDMGAQARERVELQAALRRAVETQQFELHYQPQLATATGRVLAVEALIRWPHPEWGLVSPDRFIPLAEDLGLIAPISEWVLQTACRQLQAWRTAGHTELVMAINLSARQFDGHDIPLLVAQALLETAVPADRLELELTETALMQDAEGALATLRQLHDLGVGLALDDFGTGYSSLSHLRQFPIDAIKIDKSFTADIGRNADTSAIIRAIIAMAQSLGVATVAEGVENDEQLQFLATLKCDRVQGFLFARPMPASQVVALLGAPAQAPACDLLLDALVPVD
ncbi:putative bifunctional diguanylate cyclase/phosphodiesterase [Aquabacterium sp.]|uniref:putative bifunctional diguanylate cyclase/phosphodiesterase n=1 Tax=Aquabacterium sp. TaxID=1872578 RepID=UPI002B8B81A6|nr:EAL domain-containing protein [Aquabacterium sp.]HSW03089.1 EAL domain-containing protein [Aquabacterium sp.]